jgi:hypothetical protein
LRLFAQQKTFKRRPSMKTQARWISGITIVAFAALVSMTVGLPVVHGQAAHVSWDIVHVIRPNVTAGGVASALTRNGAAIKLTGSGTFVAPAGDDGTSNAATGGGTWETFDPGSSAANVTGTYEVTGLVRWEKAPGAFPPLNDLIGNSDEASAGFVVLRISYSDGSDGTLTVGCSLEGTPATVSEGITATKGFVNYFNSAAPVAGVDANRTLFHVQD